MKIFGTLRTPSVNQQELQLTEYKHNKKMLKELIQEVKQLRYENKVLSDFIEYQKNMEGTSEDN